VGQKSLLFGREQGDSERGSTELFPGGA
jgi:hypothetical protein